MKRTATIIATLLLFAAGNLHAQPHSGHAWSHSENSLFEYPSPFLGQGLNFLFFGHGVFDGTRYHSYFASPTTGEYQIYRVSSSSLDSGWAMDIQGPVLEASLAWESHIGNPVVLQEDDGSFKMWYAAENSQGSVIGHAVSTDGISWTKHPDPVLTAAGGWESINVQTPEVIKVDGTYHMWYTAGPDTGTIQIGHATSTDGGITWTRSSSDPVVPADGSQDAVWAYFPEVHYENGTFYMWYSGYSGGNPNVGNNAIDVLSATSVDGQNWVKDPSGNPVLSGSGWDGGILIAGAVFGNQDGSYSMLYTGMGRMPAAGLGVASLAATSTSIASEAPIDFRLAQNYPNPFNPRTTIEYDLKSAGHVRLTVFDVLGREVRVLVDGFASAGQHTASLDASNLETGTYLYRLETAGGAQTRAMQVVK